MTENLSTAEQNEQIHQTVQKERRRLLDFVRKRVPTEEDAEDLLQEVFFELIETYRLMKPVEQLASWLFKVARNKITDFYRKKKNGFTGSTIWYNESGRRRKAFASGNSAC
ncbi:sigma-70 family RNA polymerase sigma factor [Pseudarcicella hirudinis]|uniref:sigma-70 family RNA polymerase sigma factor n=1 Tax=Pseudarcicella hirudinis TaxID=1079859 RepID=UPI0035EF3924